MKHLLRFSSSVASLPPRLLIKFPLAVLASCAGDDAAECEIAEVCADVGASSGRAEVQPVYEHLCFFCLVFSGTSVQKKMEGVEREDVCLSWKENSFLWRKFPYCIQKHSLRMFWGKS